MEHDWAPIDQDEDPSEMCTACFECKCCSEWTDECAGEWTPEDEVQYADPEEVRRVAERIVSENQELLKRLAEK